MSKSLDEIMSNEAEICSGSVCKPVRPLRLDLQLASALPLAVLLRLAMGRGQKRKGAEASRQNPTKRARGKTDDLSSLWFTQAGGDAMPFSSMQGSGASLLSGSLLGLGGAPVLTFTPFFGSTIEPIQGMRSG